MAALISATVGEGQTLQKFGELLAARAKYLGESAKDAVAACAIDALRSIRAVTAKATKGSVVKGVEVKQDGALYPSMKSVGGAKKICIRTNGGAEYKGGERVVIASDGAKISTCAVFRFADWRNGKAKQFLIIAQNANAALKRAKEIKRRRAMRYSGLARTALTLLMMKTATVNETANNVESIVRDKAHFYTAKTERQSGKVYAVRLADNLDYATGAVKGGNAGIDTAIRRALNKVTATINQKCKNLLFFKPLETPFPEVRQRK